MRLVLYTGKGGVGKTTNAAATAVCAAARGRRTLVASADAAHSLGDVLELRLGPQPREVAPGLDAVEVDARVEVVRYWGRIRDYLIRLFHYQGIDGVVAEELALLPGAEELTTLLAVEELAASGAYDLVVVDCAPSDSTLRLLSLPDVAHRSLRLMLPILRAVVGLAAPVASRIVELPLPGGDVFDDADELVNRNLRALRSRIGRVETSVRIVLTPERMVIDEARRAWTELALFEVGCDAVVMNRVLPDRAAREPFFEDWGRVQEERLREVRELFAPHPVLVAPLGEDEVTGLAALSRLGERLFEGVEPDALLSRAPRVRFERDGAGHRVVLPMPGATPEGLDVAKIGDEILVTAGTRRRALKLPRRLAPFDLAAARLVGGELHVSLGRSEPAEESAGAG